MSPPCSRVLRRLPLRVLLALATAAMAVCARAPAEGAGWRTGFVVAALAASGLVALAWRRGGFSTRQVLGLGLLLRLLVFPLTPVLSDDGFRYVWDGLVQVEAGANPYRYVPADPALAGLHDEPIYPALNSAQYFSVYPPLSQLVFAAGALAHPLGWLVSWYLIKLLMAAAEVGGLWLLSRMVPARALLLYAWHPLVVVEVAGQAHTEALAAALLILAVWAAGKGRGGAAAAAVAGAGWVKLVPFVLVPFVVRRFGLRAAVVAVGVTGALLLPYAAPYLLAHVGSSLDLYVRLFEFNAGPYYALKEAFLVATGVDWSKQLGPALQVHFLLALALVYVRDVREPMRLPVAFSVALGLFFACATTVHPWYLDPLLALVPLLVGSPAGRALGAAWLWLAAFSMATYWRYAGPPWGYTAAVAVGWSGWAVCAGAAGFTVIGLPALMRARARRKWRWIRAYLPAPSAAERVLDLGAGDGYVGEVVRQTTGAEVVLADVVDFNRTSLPLVRYDGRSLPFEDARFDLTLLVYVLHHARDPEAVLREARRVTKGRVVVVESVAEHPLQRRLFEPLDRLANRLRSGGAMREQEGSLDVRSDAEWRRAFPALGFEVVSASRRGRGVHRQRLYVLNPLLQ